MAWTTKGGSVSSKEFDKEYELVSPKPKTLKRKAKIRKIIYAIPKFILD
jgi:hypothetical protein